MRIEDISDVVLEVLQSDNIAALDQINAELARRKQAQRQHGRHDDGDIYEEALEAYADYCNLNGHAFQQPERGCWIEPNADGVLIATLENVNGVLYEHEVRRG